MQQQLLFYDVLIRRAVCPPQQLASLQSKYHTTLAGFSGEKRVLFELNEIQIPHSVIHDFISFNNSKQKIQIDIIFICKHFVLVLEVKNITGRIDFDDRRRQFIRTRLDGQQESFMNPVDQVKRHQQYLESIFLAESEFIPIESAIVIANPNTLIGQVPSEVPVFNVSGLRTIIDGLYKKYAHVTLNMRRVHVKLKSHCVEQSSKLSAKDYEIRRGVFCLDCGELMIVESRGFKCLKCCHWDVNDRALKSTLKDYKILYGNEITNARFRDFCGIGSPSTANNFLTRLQLPFKGKNKGRVYLLDEF